MSVTTSTSEHVSLGVREHRYASDAESAGVRSTRRRTLLPGRQVAGRWISLLPATLPGLLLLLVWYAVTATGRISSLILPPPAAVFSSLGDGLSSGLFLHHALITIQESLLGFGLAVLIALPLGYGVAKSRFVAHTLQPYVAAGQAIPAIVIAPFLYLWFGQGLLSVMIMCMLVVLFPMLLNTVLGLQSIDQEVLYAARLDGASAGSLLTHIEFPLALPAILTAVRSGLTLSIVGALVGEFFCRPDEGLGALVFIATNQYNMAFMFATVLVLGVLAAVYFAASKLLVKLAEAIY